MLESVSEVLNTIIEVFVLVSNIVVESFPATMEPFPAYIVPSGTVKLVSDVVVLRSVSSKETELFRGTVESFPGNIGRLMESFPGNVERLSFVVELFPNTMAE